MATDRCLETALRMFRTQEALGEAALEQVPDGALHTAPSPGTNSIAVLVRHLAGNMRSRWTEFLTTDGEKPWRRRDEEFEEGSESRGELTEIWTRGWSTLFATVESLGPDDLGRTVRVRGREQTVLEAVLTQLGHYSYHVGQMVYLARLLAGSSWKTLSVPRGESDRYNAEHGYRP